jgi:hypothetical protein
MSESSVNEKKGLKEASRNLQVGAQDEMVIVDFNEKVEAVGLSTKRAIEMAAALVEAALEASKGSLELPEPLASMVTGPTGKFSRGKISEDDAGDINIKVNIADGLVKVQFGYPVTWLGLTADSATDLGNLLTAHAKMVKSTSASN